MKQKLNFFFAALAVSLTLGVTSCSKDINDDENLIANSSSIKKGSSQSARLAPCPEGYTAYLDYSFDAFNFHRPVTSCESGFWFCTKGGRWSIKCRKNVPNASIDGRTANIWAKEVDGQAELHFPIALKETEGYTAEDLSTFNVDDEYTLSDGITLKKGDYPVTETSTELVVLVDLVETK